MKLILRGLAILLGLALTATAVVWAADATIWNQTYLETAATDSNLATKVSAVLPDVAASFAPGTQAKAAVAATVTPAYVQTQLDQIIPAFVVAYRHNGAKPTLNLTDLGQQVSLLSLPIPSSLQTVINSPQPLVPSSLDTPLRLVGSLTGRLKLLSPIAAVVLVVLIVLLGRRHRFKVLALGLAAGAVFTAIAAALMQLPPRLIGAALDSSVAHPLVPAIHGFANTVASAQAHQLLEAAVGLLAAAAVSLALGGVLHVVGRIRPHHESPTAPEA